MGRFASAALVLFLLSAVGASGRPLRDLYIQDYSGVNQPAVYVDDVRLVQ